MAAEHPAASGHGSAFSALRQAAAEVANGATASGQEGFVRVPQELLWRLNGALEADGRVTRREVREFFGRYLLDREPHSTLDDVADAAVLLLGLAGGSSSPLTPGAGDATQGAKDGLPGRPSDSPPPSDPRMKEAQKCLYAAATLAHAHGKFKTAMKFEEARLGLIKYEVEARDAAV